MLSLLFLIATLLALILALTVGLFGITETWDNPFVPADRDHRIDRHRGARRHHGPRAPRAELVSGDGVTVETTLDTDDGAARSDV